MPGEPTLVNTFLRETSTGIIYALSKTEKTLIGRALDCQIVLNSPQDVSISRYHAEVRPLAESGGWEICDRDSNNGTYVNGKRLSGCQILQPGDRLNFGQSPAELIFEVQAAEIATEGRKNPLIEPKKPFSSDLSRSTWFPLRSKWRQLLEGEALQPAMSLFLQMLEKPWWLLLLLVLVTYGLAAIASPLLPFFSVTAPKMEGVSLALAVWLKELIKAFPKLAIAVLVKELIKALPVLAIYGLGQKLPTAWRERIRIRNPLDGMVLSAAAAIGMVLFEIFYSKNISNFSQLISQLWHGLLAEKGKPAVDIQETVVGQVFVSAGANLAYSGIFGYYLGVSAMRSPRQRWKLLGFGYFLASSFHLFVELFPPFSFLQQILQLLGYFVFAAFFLKGRDLSN